MGTAKLRESAEGGPAGCWVPARAPAACVGNFKTVQVYGFKSGINKLQLNNRARARFCGFHHTLLGPLSYVRGSVLEAWILPLPDGRGSVSDGRGSALMVGNERNAADLEIGAPGRRPC